MALPNEGDLKTTSFSIDIGELLELAEVGEATAASIEAMTVAAKTIIKRTVGATIIAATPLSIAVTLLALAATTVAEKAVEKALGDRDTLKVTLYLRCEIDEVFKQNYLHKIREWKVYDFAVSFV